MIQRFIITAILLSAIFVCHSHETTSLKSQLESIIAEYNATIGIAVSDDHDTIAVINNDIRYPMMSVFKVHVALTALKKMQSERISPDSIVLIPEEYLRYGTYSPLRDATGGESVSLPLREIIDYTISLSDNNTCDYIIEFCGGTEKINDFIKSIGIGETNITCTEDDMHRDINYCHNNWATPTSIIRLLQYIYNGKIINGTYLNCLMQSMLATSTGMDKLRRGIPEDIALAHKTGSSDRLPNGVKIGDNDVGIIFMPDGRLLYLAVFITNSTENDTTNAFIISQIANCVIKYINQASSAN